MARSAFIYDPEKKEFRQRSVSEGILTNPHQPVVRKVNRPPDDEARRFYRPPLRPQAAGLNTWKKYFWAVCGVLMLIWVITVVTQLRKTADTRSVPVYTEDSELDFLGVEPRPTR